MTKSYAGGLHTLMVNDIEMPAVLALIWKTTQSPALSSTACPLSGCLHRSPGLSAAAQRLPGWPLEMSEVPVLQGLGVATLARSRIGRRPGSPWPTSALARVLSR
jgi:hypothetical protein